MAELAPGCTIGGYHVEALLGEGGMGQVFRAVQLSLERPVALKVIAASAAPAPELRERFRLEALAAAAIEHPHVVPIYEAGEEDAVLFIAMRLIEGASLAQMIARRRRLDLELVVRLAAQVGGALDAAHERGILHRDVKPANVLVQGDAEFAHAFLTDFGIARHLEREALTATGRVVGTLDYLAPEALRGEPVDQRADVYGLGCVIFEALTGSVPFPRSTDAARISAHLFDPAPPLRDLVPVPAELEAVISSALAKDPAERPRRTGDLAAAVVTAAGSRRAPVSLFSGDRMSRAGPVRTNLPERLRGLIGREQELAALCSLCRTGGQPIVTVTGAGGVGKTSLALAAGRALLEDFEDGVFFVALEDVRSAASVPGAIAATMELGDDPDVPVLDRLICHARRRRVLLIIDNFEHVMDAAIAVRRIAEEAAAARLLITSQAPLHLQSEQVLPLAPLSVPRDASADFDVIKANPSVALLVANARRVDPSFRLTPQIAGVTAELCARLDGLPLALELAGARLALLSPTEFLKRVAVSLDAVGAGPRDLPARQRGLRATLDWTTSQLDAKSRALLDQLAIFAGGFTLPLAEAVACGDVLDDFAQLLDLALVRRASNERYSMPPPVRLYALESLRQTGNEERARRRHARTMLTMLESARRVVYDDARAWFATVAAESSNIREALNWARAGDPSIHAGITALAADYFNTTGYQGDFVPEIDAALAQASDPAVRARLLTRRVYALQGFDQLEAASAAVAACRELGDSRDLVEALQGLVDEQAEASNAARALAAALEARAVADRMHDATAGQLADLMTAQALEALGRHSEASRLLADVRRHAPQHGLVSVYATMQSADVALKQGDAEQALAAYCQWLGAYRGQSWRANEAYTIDGAAVALVGLGRHEEALTAAAISDLLRNEFSIVHPTAAKAFRDSALKPAWEALRVAEQQAAHDRARSLGHERGARWVVERTNTGTQVATAL